MNKERYFYGGIALVGLSVLLLTGILVFLAIKRRRVQRDYE